MKPYQYFASYFAALIRASPSRFARACTLSLLTALFSGTGLLMLIPLLQFTGWLPHGAEHNESVFRALHIHSLKLSLPATLGIFFAVILLVGLLDYVARRQVNELSFNFLFKLQQELNQHIAHAKWSYILTRRLQDANHLMSIGIARTSVLTTYCLQLVNDSIVALVYLVFALKLSTKLTLFALFLSVFPAVLIRRNRAHSIGRDQFLASRRIQEKLAQFLGGVKLAKSGNLTEQYILHFEDLIREGHRFQSDFIQNESRIRFSFQVSGALVFCCVFLVALEVLHVPLVALVALLILYSRLMLRLSNLQQTYLRAVHIVPVYSELRSAIADFKRHREYPTDEQNSVLTFCDEIRFENVSYAYTEKSALKDVSCSIRFRAMTAVVGPSGSGKTTFADLLLGLLSPQSGRITVDGVPLGVRNIRSWRSLVGYVPQEPYFFNDTVRANLTWLCPGVSDDQIWETLRTAAARGLIRMLPKGLDSPIGDKGLQLSGGERQRLALARALLGNPRVLVLDEATSALDHRNEALIQAALRRLADDMAIITIAHRYSTIQLADEVLVLREGALVESGSIPSLTRNPISAFSTLFS